jgi:amidase
MRARCNLRTAALIATAGLLACSPSAVAPPDRGYVVEEKSLAMLESDLATRRVTSERLVEMYLDRIRRFDHAGPELHSVLSVNPRALDDARRSDRERSEGQVRGPLHGIPVLLKDNIESMDPLPTTAGSLALEKNISGRDAPLVARLREAGAVILGKNNLTEWAAIRGRYAVSNGWSAVGGLTVNPYGERRSACGSSSGSGVAVAANFAAVAVGTDTDGSIICPAASNAIVGLRPTVGLVSRRHIVPISTMQDTAGPMARTVADAALVLSIIAGRDEGDPATLDADRHRVDYVAALSDQALVSKRLGIVKSWMGYSPKLDAVFESRLADLRSAGATLITIDREIPQQRIVTDEFALMAADFRPAINAYLLTTPQDVTSRTLADLISFNRQHADRELLHFGQEMFEQAEASASKGQDFEKLRTKLRREAREEGIDTILKTYRVDALIAPSFAPVGSLDLVNGDQILGGIQGWPAIAGYPHLTVPMGQVAGVPVGLSFIGSAWSDAALLAMGYAFEQRTHARQLPTFDSAH